MSIEPDYIEIDAAPAFGEVDRGRKTHRVQIGKDEIFRFDAIVISEDRNSIVNFFNSIRVAVWGDYIQVKGGEGKPKVFLKVSNLARRLLMTEEELWQMKKFSDTSVNFLDAIKWRVQKLEALLIKDDFIEALNFARDRYSGVLEKPALFLKFWPKYLKIFKRYNATNYLMIRPETLCKVTIAAMEILQNKPKNLNIGVELVVDGRKYIIQEEEGRDLQIFQFKGHKLGKGGAGHVDAVLKISHGKLRALKRASQGLKIAEMSFKREKDMIEFLCNKGVPRIQSSLQMLKAFGTVLLEGAVYQGDLKKLIKEDSLSSAEKVKCCNMILETLVRAHQTGIYHQDIKPSNIFIRIEENDKGEKTITPYLCDWGVADTEVRQKIVGTPSYATEGDWEIFLAKYGRKGSKQDLVRRDYFAMGKTLLELITGDLHIFETTPFNLTHSKKDKEDIVNLPKRIKERAKLIIDDFANENKDQRRLIRLLKLMVRLDPIERDNADIEKYLNLSH